MRETSYFKNQTDDDASTFAAKKDSIQKQMDSNFIPDQIHIQQQNHFSLNHQQLTQQPNSNYQNSNFNTNKQNNKFQQQLRASDVTKNESEHDFQKLSVLIEEIQKQKSDNQNQLHKTEESEREQQKYEENVKDGIKMFKMQSKSQLRWNRQGKKSKIESKGSIGEMYENNYDQPISPMSNNDVYHNLNVQTQGFNDLVDQFPSIYHDQFQINSAILFQNKSPLSVNKPLNKENETDVKNQKEVPYTSNSNSSANKNKKNKQAKQLNKRNLFESCNLVKSEEDREFKLNEGSIKFQNNENESEVKQMFTSMSDIGFPQNIHNYNLKQNTNSKKDLSLKSNQNELITIEQIQKLMNTQNNWRVRTMTIDQILHDIQQKVLDDPEQILNNSEKYLDFFVQMLADQNFKIVLNTLNVINIIAGMPQQKLRYEKLMKFETEGPNKQNPFQWGISNSCLSRHIPQIVKKLADSKNIIRQEASKSLFLMNEIMRSGNKKENNFIALILPYLNNSSNWHIREELLNLLIRCFLSFQDKNEFSSIQVLDSILQLLRKDTNDKIRSLALESIVAYASIYYKQNEKNISELLSQLTDDKELLEFINQRIETGMFPYMKEQTIEFPFFEHQQIQNYDVDSVAQSMTNQTQISQGGYSYIKQNVNTTQIQQQLDNYNKRKKSIGAVSGQNVNNQSQINETILSKAIQRGNSSGRKIVVATANAPKLQNGLQQIEEIIKSNQQFNKRTASANNPNFEFENKSKSINKKHNPSNSFNISAGMVVLEQDQNFQMHQNMIGFSHQSKEFQQFQNALYVDDILSNGKNNYSIVSQAQEFNGSNFLPSLQKSANQSNIDSKLKPFSQFSNHSDQRIIGSGGGIGLQQNYKQNDFESLQNGQGFAAGIKFNHNRPGLQLLTQIGGEINLPNSKTSKRNMKSNQIQHGTPGQPIFKYQDQIQKGINLAQNHFNRGNSGKIMGNHQLNNNQTEQNSSIIYDNGRFQIANQQINDSQQINMLNYSGNLQGKLMSNEINGQVPSYILGGSIGHQMNEINHSKQISALSGSIGNTSNINSTNFNVGLHIQESTHNKLQQRLMSENGYNIENSDVFSIHGMQSHQSTYNQNNTPNQFNFNQHEQILYSASSGYRHVNQGIVRINDSGAGITRQHLNYDQHNLPVQAQGPPEFGFEVDEQIESNSFNFANIGPHEKFTPDHSQGMQGNDLFSSGAGINNKNKFDLKSQLLFSDQQNSINNQPAYLNMLKDEYQKRNNEQNHAYLNNIYSISGQGSASGQQRNHIISSGESNNRLSGIVKKFQNGQSTFYSNGTNMTGVTGATATTGASGVPLQNREANQVLNELQKYQNFSQDISQLPINLKNTIQSNDQINGVTSQTSQQQNAQIQFNNQQNQVLGRQGPIKATRFQQQEKFQMQIGQISTQNSSSRQQQQDQQNELVIDTRRVKVGKPNGLKASINSNTNNANTSIGLFNNSKNFRQLNSKIIGSQTLDNDPLIQIVASSSTENIDHAVTINQFKKSEGIHQNNYDLNLTEQSTNNDNIGFLNEEQDPSQTYQIVYTSLEDLEALEKPEKEFKKCLSKGQGIYSNDWIKQFEGCQIIRQVCKHHQSLIIQTANQLQNLVSTLIKLADSLRSAVSRISLMTLNEMFISLKRVMEPCLDPIMKILLKKSSDTNNFIAEVADQCLQSLVQNCQEQKVLQILQLQNMNSRSNLYRLKICLCLQNIVKQLGNNILFFNQNDKLLVLLANYLHDPNQEVRQASKIAFVCMSQQIMGQNELEKLLQRVLNEVQYKKVKEYLDKEPSHLAGNQSAQIDFVITNANNNNQNLNCQPIAKKIVPSSKQIIHKQSQKTIKQLQIKSQQQQNNQNIERSGAVGSSQNNLTSGLSEQQNQENLVLNIQSKQIINPQQQKQEQIAQKSLLQQNKNGVNTQSQQQIQSAFSNGAGNASQRGGVNGNGFFQAVLTNGQKNMNINQEQNSHHFDAFFIESLKDFILKTQINDWRSRLEASEALFDFIKTNSDKVQNNLKTIELCEAISRLINDANAKIQISALENFQKLFINIFQYVKMHILPIYKSLLTNLGSSNVGVRKISDQIIKNLNENLQQDRLQYLLAPLIQIIQNSNNTKLKTALHDQLIELLSDYQQQQTQSGQQIQESQTNQQLSSHSIYGLIQKQIPQIAFKLLEDSKNEMKIRCEKLLKKLYQILGQQQLFDQCPQSKLQKVCDICLSNGLISSTGQQSTGQISINKNNNSQNFGTGTFGANGSSLILNSRI